MVWMPAEDLAAHELRLNYSDVNEADVWELGVRLPRFFFFFILTKLRFNTITNAAWTMNAADECRMLWIWITPEPNHVC